jgi:short-subunit dehydrogenase
MPKTACAKRPDGGRVGKSIVTAPRHILITGASSGIGAALAVHYAAPGVRLVLGGRDARRLDEVAARCAALGAQVESHRVDVTDRPAMEAWITMADERGALDLVVANAGISAGTGGAQEGESPDQVSRIFDVNLHGVLNTLDPAIARMTGRGRGHVAIISSLAGFHGWPGAPAYAASKAAVRSYGEGLFNGLRAQGVALSVVCPGFIRTPMTAINDFPMPFLMSPERAATIIARGLAHRKSRIVFPAPMAALVWLSCVLPDGWVQAIQRLLPDKPAAPAQKDPES